MDSRPLQETMMDILKDDARYSFSDNDHFISDHPSCLGKEIGNTPIRSPPAVVSPEQRKRKRVRISCDLPSLHRESIIHQEEYKSQRRSSLRARDSTCWFENIFEETFPHQATKSDPQEDEGQWLSRQELDTFKKKAKRLCRSIDLGFSCLHKAYAITCEGDPEWTFRNNEKTVEELVRDADFSEQRGLERWSSSLHSTFRSSKIVEVRTAVFLEQSKQVLSTQHNPKKIAIASENASSSSLRFAQLLGSVDQAVAQLHQRE